MWADVEALGDRLDGLRRIGIDEISYKRHHRYLTVVVDHDSGRLLWAAPGRDRATLRTFFELLGPDRCAAISHVSADQADGIDEISYRRSYRYLTIVVDHDSGRPGGLDRRDRRRMLPGRGAVRRPVPRGQVGHRGP